MLDLADTSANATVQFDDPTLVAPVTKTVTITTANTVLPAAPTANADAFAMLIAPTNGYFGGYFGYAGTTPQAGVTGSGNPVSTPRSGHFLRA